MLVGIVNLKFPNPPSSKEHDALDYIHMDLLIHCLITSVWSLPNFYCKLMIQLAPHPPSLKNIPFQEQRPHLGQNWSSAWHTQWYTTAAMIMLLVPWWWTVSVWHLPTFSLMSTHKSSSATTHVLTPMKLGSDSNSESVLASSLDASSSPTWDPKAESNAKSNK